MKNKLSIILTIILGIYAFIPILGAILYEGNYGGDPGPYWVLMIFPFWPLFGTFQLFFSLLSSFTGFFGVAVSKSTLFNLSAVFNFFLWTSLAYFISKLITKKND